MNEYALVILSVAAIGALAVVLFRCVVANERMSGSAIRSREREDKGRDKLLLMLIEKRDLDPEKAAKIHAHERMQASQLDAGLEKVLGARPRNGPPPRKTAPAPKPPDVQDWADAMHQ